jgi:RNA polymerase sigma-70 factor (ECF subfamily)
MGKRAETALPQKNEASEWVSLVHAIVERDEQALAKLYDLTVERVYALAYAITRNSADAEEVVADVYLQIWQRATQYAEDRGTVIAWLMVHCRSLALDLLRRRRSHEHGQQQLAAEPLEDSDPSAEDILGAVQEGTLVHQALGLLSEIQQQLIALAFFRDMSHQEIAATMQLPLGTVKSHIRRGLQTLRTVLEQ